uniref:Enoyl reductase (ER) domain-containing protein n=1 Tax=Ditylenchus dipsaci TaxID=166011 RepID=A0A915DGY6_9BILA
MRSAVIRNFGAAENIVIEKAFPIPVLAEKQVLVKVKAAGVNPVDTYIRSGTYASLPALPYIPGREGSGVIAQLGTSFAVVSSDFVYPLPMNTTFNEGATLGIAYNTAYRALFVKASAQSGQTVFIHGISGGVGLAATQLAKAHGLQVIGAASTEQGTQLAIQNGASQVYNHREQGYIDRIKQENPAGFNIILEMLANVNLNKDLELIANFGTIVVVGSRGSVEIDPRRLMQKESSVVGLLSTHITVEEYKRTAEQINKLLESGHIKPHVGRIFPLEQIVEAHKLVIDAEGALGKIVLIVDQD